MNQYELAKLQKNFKSSKPDPDQPDTIWASKAIELIAAQQKRIEFLEHRLEQEVRDPGGKSWENVR